MILLLPVRSDFRLQFVNQIRKYMKGKFYLISANALFTDGQIDNRIYSSVRFQKLPKTCIQYNILLTLPFSSSLAFAVATTLEQ